MIDGLAMGCMYGVTTGCHNMHQVHLCNTDRYNSSVVHTMGGSRKSAPGGRAGSGGGQGGK